MSAGTSGAGGDRLRPSQIESRRRRALVRYVRQEVHPYSELHRRRFAAAGLTPAAVTGPDDLSALAPLALGEVDDAAALVLRPTEEAIRRHGDPELRARLVWASIARRQAWLNAQVIDPRFKPVHWTVADGVLLGWSADDLDRLADLGRRWLAMAGLRRRDALVTVLPMAPSLPFWQLVLGARAAGISTVHAGRPLDAASLRRMGPTALAGRLEDLLALDGWEGLDGLRTVLVVGQVPPEADREALAERAGPDVAVVAAWAPPGVRSLWAECRGGRGLHTWADAEVLQSGDDGTLVWTPIGWRGSVVLRLRTGVIASVDEDECPTCGRTTPRVDPQSEVRVTSKRRRRT